MLMSFVLNCSPDGEREIPALVVALRSEGVGERRDIKLFVVLALTAEPLERIEEIPHDGAELELLDDFLARVVTRVPALADGAFANELGVLIYLVGDLAGGAVLRSILEADDAVRVPARGAVDLLDLAEARKTEPVVVLEVLEEISPLVPVVALLAAEAEVGVGVDALVVTGWAVALL